MILKVIRSPEEYFDFLSKPEKKSNKLLLFDFSDKKFQLQVKQPKEKRWMRIIRDIYGKEVNFRYTMYGKPFSCELQGYFNISHKKNILLIGLSQEEIGVDIELLTLPLPTMRALQFFFTQEELNYLRKVENKSNYFGKCWSLKEAYTKCLGIGMSLSPRKDIQFFDNVIYHSDEYHSGSFSYGDYFISYIKRKG